MELVRVTSPLSFFSLWLPGKNACYLAGFAGCPGQVMRNDVGSEDELTPMQGDH